MSSTFGMEMLLDDPFFQGIASTTDVPGVYEVALGGHGYIIDPKYWHRETIQRFRNPYTQSEEPGEHSLNIQGAWLRSTSSWFLGAGQDFWDYPDAVHQRFRSSKGLDFWTDQHRVQLLHDTRNIRASAATNLKILSVGAFFYIVDGTEVRWTADPSVASPVFTASNINIAEGAQNVNDFTTDGAFVYAAVGVNGIHKTAIGAIVSTHLSATQATLVQYANGRLIAAANNSLYEIDAAGVATLIKTHASTSFAWNIVCPAPNGIYAAGNIGDRAELYYIGVRSDGVLDVPIYAGTLPDGETIQSMQFYNGVMVLGTSIGIRLGVVVSNNGLSYASAIKTGKSALALEPQAEFVWFSWSNYDGVSTGLGRVVLNEFTDTFVPAYSSDLMAATQGNVIAIATFGTRRYFAVSGVGFYAEFGNLVASGTLDQGWITYTTTERKVALSVDLRHEPLAGSISISITQEDGTSSSIGVSNSAGSLGTANPLTIGNVSSEMFDLNFTLNRSGSDATAGPKLRRWTFRALVTPIRYDQIDVPIILKERVDVPDTGDGHTVEFDVLGEWSYLKSLESSGAPTTYQHGTQAYTVYVEQVSEPQMDDRVWIPDRSMLEGIVMVRLVTL